MITVLAGVNGAGKSSIGGSAIRRLGGDWYNPDELAHKMREQFPDRSLQEVNGAVWLEGLNRLNQAIANNHHFVFETTLGGQTMTNKLLDAIAYGVPVSMWYCGLGSVELHIERVAARVERGGHDIPEEMIRKRYETSMGNLCRLTPGLSELAVYDNSKPKNAQGQTRIRRVLHMSSGVIQEMAADMPEWAKPVAAVCMQHFRMV